MTPTRPNAPILSLAAATALLLSVAAPATASGLDATAVADEVISTADAATGATTQAGPSDRASRPQAAGEPLVGTFAITAGECGGEGVTSGSYFRMATPAGDTDDGPWVGNGSSSCGDNTWTPLSPGTDGGFSTAGHQPHPDPNFDGDGNALADRIIEPTGFYGTDFSVATSPVDPQTGAEAPVPVIEGSGGELSGQVTAWGAAWNRQHFNQGSPKPDGSRPGGTFGPSGTYDPATGAFTLEWASLIVGGPFDNFTGLWHLEGTFRPSGASGGGSPTSSSTPGGSTGPQDGTGDGAAGSPDGADADARSAGSGSLPRTGGPLSAAAFLLVAAGLVGRRLAPRVG